MSFKVTSFIMGVILIAAIIGGSFYWYGQLGDAYNIEPDDSNFQEFQANQKNISQSVENARGKMRNFTSLSVTGQFFQGTILAFSVSSSVLFNVLGSTGALIDLMVSVIPLPPWLISLASTAIVIFALFALVSMVFGRNNT